MSPGSFSRFSNIRCLAGLSQARASTPPPLRHRQLLLHLPALRTVPPIHLRKGCDGHPRPALATAFIPFQPPTDRGISCDLGVARPWAAVEYKRSLSDILGTEEGTKWRKMVLKGSGGSGSGWTGSGGPAESVGGMSQHPADRLIRELVASGRDAVAAEVDQVIHKDGFSAFSCSWCALQPTGGRETVGKPHRRV